MLMLLLGLRGGLELRGGCWEVAVAHIGVLLLPKEIQRLTTWRRNGPLGCFTCHLLSTITPRFCKILMRVTCLGKVLEGR